MKRSHLLYLASLSAISISTMANAQAASSAPSLQNDTVNRDSGLDEIVVTAQRREQNIQDVPLAVTSFSVKQLEQQQVTTALDIARLIPNMFGANNIGTGSANSYYIRSLGQGQSFPTFEPQVGTYVDDIYISRQNANNFALFDIEQVQVLRGPQGTLFGRNSTGGAIVLTLTKPSDNVTGYIEGSYGKYNSFSGRASIDLPLGEHFLTKTSVYGLTNDGYVNNLTNGQKLNFDRNWGAREAVRVLPDMANHVTWDISVDYAHNDSASVLNFPGPGGKRISYSGFSRVGGALAPFLTGRKANKGQGAEVESWGAMSNLAIDIGAGTLNIITGYRGLLQAQQVDFPNAPLGPLVPFDQNPTGQFALAVDLSSHEYTQEIKWTGELGEHLKYTAGLYYLYEVSKNDFGAVLNLGGVIGIPGVTDFPVIFVDEFTRNATDSKAAYLQAEYKLTSDLALTVGGRFTHEVKRVSARPNQPDNPASSGFTTAEIKAAGWRTRLQTDQFTPRIALQYQANPGLMLYASATRGFQGGGWNGLTDTAQTYNDFGPETLWSYEAGVRFETSDHKLRLNSTFFYQDVHKYQLLADVPQANNFVTTNAADLISYGLETELSWRPVEEFTLTASMGLQKARYTNPSIDTQNQLITCQSAPGPTNPSCGQGIVSPAGNFATPAYSPPVNVALSAFYDIGLNQFRVTPSAGIQWVAAQHTDTAGTELGKVSDYFLLDLGVTIQKDDVPLKLTVQCRNCTTTNYATFTVFGYNYFNRPGTWDIKVNYKF